MEREAGKSRGFHKGKRCGSRPWSLKKVVFLSAVILFLSLSLPVIAADLYVSPHGTGSDCTQGHPCSFQTALDKAQTDGEADTIHVAPGTYEVLHTLTYSVEGGEGGLVIQGQDPDNPPVLDGKGKVQIMVFQIGPDTTGTLTLENLTFINGSSPDDGGGLCIYSDSTDVTIRDLTFAQNSASGAGGGVFIKSAFGRVSVTQSVFTKNSANYYGGGIFAYSAQGDVEVRGSIFKNNRVIHYGGGAYIASSGNVAVASSRFTDNQADSGGGVILCAVSSGDTSLTGSVFIGNRAFHNGGGACIFSTGYTAVTNNVLYKNETNGRGGGLYLSLNSDDAVGDIHDNMAWQNTEHLGKVKGEGIYVESDGDGNGVSSIVSLYSNDSGEKSNTLLSENPWLANYDGGKLDMDSGYETKGDGTTKNHKPKLRVKRKPKKGHAPLEVTFKLKAKDKDKDQELTCYADFDGDGEWDQTLNDCRGINSLTYTYHTEGVYIARFQVVDPYGAYKIKTKKVVVKRNPNNTQPPVIELNANEYSLKEGQTYTYTFSAYDPEGGTVTCSLEGAPGWVSLTDNGDGTYTVTSTPGYDAYIHQGPWDDVLKNVTQYNIVCSDGSLTSEVGVQETVNDVNRPVHLDLSDCDTQIPAGEVYSCYAHGYDDDPEDNAWLRYTLVDKPTPDTTINESTGYITFRAPVAFVRLVMTVSVEDRIGSDEEKIMYIDVV